MKYQQTLNSLKIFKFDNVYRTKHIVVGDDRNGIFEGYPETMVDGKGRYDVNTLYKCNLVINSIVDQCLKKLKISAQDGKNISCPSNQ